MTEIDTAAQPDLPDGGLEMLPAVREETPAGVDRGQPAGAAGAKTPVVYADVTGQPGERLPILPRALHRENIRGTVATFIGLQWHRSRYHGLRCRSTCSRPSCSPSLAWRA